MKKRNKTTLTILFVSFWLLLACNNHKPTKETNSKDIDDRDIPMDNSVDTTDIGNDTLGTGDGQGPDHFEH